MNSNLLYELDLDQADFLEAIAKWCRIGKEPPSQRSLTYLDSFDWRLFRKGLTLRFEKAASVPPRLCLIGMDGGTRQAVRIRRVPSFARELDRSALRKRLEEIFGERRILGIATLNLSCVESRVLDDEEKTVARILHAEGTASGPDSGEPVPIRPVLEVQPVRGYRSVLRELRGYIEALPGVRRRSGSLFELALEAVGREAGDYSSSVTVTLASDMVVEEATVAILESQFDVVQANWHGVRKDWDPEFLHDLRVATRRVRSLLTQFKNALPSAGFKRLRKDLRWLGRVTGPKRDIDVYLSTLASYDQVFPLEVVEGLQPLRKYLKRRQQEEQAAVSTALASGRYRRLISDWQEAIRIGHQTNTEVPIAKIAAARIIAVDRKILAIGEKIGDRLDPARLHDLRIECKKLRYLLEFFRTLFGHKVLRRLVKELKGLQDVLGMINDLQVQQQNLQRYAKEMASEDVRQTETLLNMGRLLGHFETSQVKLFPQFQASFRSFRRRAVQEALAEGLSKYLEESS